MQIKTIFGLHCTTFALAQKSSTVSQGDNLDNFSVPVVIDGNVFFSFDATHSLVDEVFASSQSTVAVASSQSTVAVASAEPTKVTTIDEAVQPATDIIHQEAFDLIICFTKY